MASIQFENVKSDAGLAKVNSHMACHSYVFGFCPTQQVGHSVQKDSSLQVKKKLCCRFLS